MKKLYYFFVYCGEILFIWSIIFIISISLQSISIKGQVNYGDRCYASFNDNFIKEYDYEGVILTSNKLKCNTYYLEYNSELNEQENLIFLLSLSKLFSDNSININTHLIIKNENYQILATIVDYQVTYTKSII